MTPQAVLVCLFLGIVIGWVAARFERPRERHLHPHGPPSSNVRTFPARPYDQETQ